MSSWLRWQIGDVRVTRVQEFEAPGIGFLLPDATPGNLAEIPWLSPYLDHRGEAVGSGHSLILEVGERRIVVDLESTPGHTPGHVSVQIESRGERAVITGDLVHHPAQFARPGWKNQADSDRAQAEQTRRECGA